MKIGKVPENILKRSVFNQLGSRRRDVILRPGVGEDCCAASAAADEAFVFSTDPITGTDNDIGRLAVHINCNDIASSGAKPIGILVSLILPPGASEALLRQIMGEIDEACGELGIEVMGGHTEVSDAVTRPLINITGVGKVKLNALVSTGGLSVGDEIVMTKWAGLEGTSIIANKKAQMLSETLPEEIIKEAASFIKYISVAPEAQIAAGAGATAMHDVTEGGVFGALWEMGEASDVGICVDLNKIPIRQETIEVCEALDVNPYMLVSSGSLLIGCKNGNLVVSLLAEKGISSAVIGRAVEGKDRVALNNGEPRYLTPPGRDELYKIYEK